MEKKMSLSQIGLYNPQRTSDSDVEALFVVRTKLFDFLIEKLKKESTNSIPQHYLIIAQRGMGKTTLLKRIEVELRKNDYNQLFIPLLLPEEQYNLKNIAEFWLNVLDALADTLEIEEGHDDAVKIDIKIKDLQQIKNDEELANEAYKFLKSFCLSLNRRPVLLIDNMNLIFNRLEKSQQHTLRAWLMQNGAPILVGASAVAMEDTSDYGAPFYDAFQIHYLKKLTFDELKEILINLARLTQSDEVIPLIEKETGRIKTLHQLTGGNTRTAVMLFRLIIKGFSKEINDDLEAILDEITPLYKARFEELSTQMQVIVDAIALHWDPINLEQLRNETRYDNGQLSPQLKRLVELGWIEKLDAYKAKGSAYQISERFFNIWFLMRRSSRRQKKELYCLSKFLESFYGEDIQSVAEARLLCKSTCVDHVSYSLALAEVVKNKKLSNKLRNKSYTELQEFAKTDPEIFQRFDILKEPTNSKNDNDSKESEVIERNKYLMEESSILESIKFFENDKDNMASLMVNLGNLYQDYLQKYKESEISYKKSIELDEKSAIPWNNLGNLNRKMLKYNDAEIDYKQAVLLDNNYSISWFGLGNLYQQNLKRYKEAENAYKTAIELDEKFTFAWLNLGYLYHVNLLNYKDAEMAYKKAIDYGEKSGYAWNNLGNLYQDYLNRYDDAENAYRQAIALDEKFEYPKYNLLFLYRDKMNRINEAEEIFNSLKIDAELVDSYWLNKSLFDLHKKNEGVAKESLNKALAKNETGFPENTQDDWRRFGSIVVKLGYGNWLATILEEKGYDIVLSPYYVAIKAMSEKDSEAYLISKAVEIREPARKLIEIMKNY